MRWTLKQTPSSEEVNTLSESLNVDKLIAHLLLQRDITNYKEAKKFFRPSLEDIHSPFLMKDMDKAVERIEKAMETGENILVYGITM